jgi:dUTPase
MNKISESKIQLIKYITKWQHYKLDKFNYDTMKFVIFIDNDEKKLIDILNEISNIPMNTIYNDKLSRYEITYLNTNIIDILSLLYDDIILNKYYNKSEDTLYEEYLHLLYNIMNNRFSNVLTCKFKKTLSNAVIPTKKHASDAAYDLTIVKEVKKISNMTTLYDTGISIMPPLGFRTNIYLRSSMVNSGYILSNLTGIIDSNYSGNLMIALTKIDPELPNFELPFKCCQLELVRHNHYLLEEINNDFNDTIRGGDGGICRAAY